MWKVRAPPAAVNSQGPFNPVAKQAAHEQRGRGAVWHQSSPARDLGREQFFHLNLQGDSVLHEWTFQGVMCEVLEAGAVY